MYTYMYGIVTVHYTYCRECSLHFKWGDLTQRQLLPRVRGQGEAQDRHGGDEDAGDDEVEEVVECASPDLDCEGDVQVGVGAAVIEHLMTFRRDTWIQSRDPVPYKVPTSKKDKV